MSKQTETNIDGSRKLSVSTLAVFSLTGHVVRMPLHFASGNMAALLRSARLLKFSPSGLLQVAGTKRNGLAPSRLYSGTLGGCRTGVCSRHISPAAENASRYASVC